MSALRLQEPSYTPSLLEALKRAARNYTPHDNYAMRTSPKFWLDVFVQIHGREPKIQNDPRTDPRDDEWDELFRLGFKAFNELFGEDYWE